MLKARIIALILGALLPAHARAQPAPVSRLAGIWEGTIGTLPVRACFTTRDYGTFGAYYYASQLKLLGLEAQEGAPGAYNEVSGDREAHWRNVQAAGDNLTATWASGQRMLPVRLHRVAGGSGESGACASVDFHQPRLAGVRTISARGTVDGTAFTKLTLDTAGHFEITVQTFALDGDGPAVRRINNALGADLAGTPPGWFECISNSLDASPLEGTETITLEPAMISRRWLSVATNADVSCGGAHPDAYASYQLFDLTTGAEMELLDWFLPRAVKREHIEGAEEDSRTLEPAFRTFLLTGWHPADGDNAECESVLREADYWNAGLTRDGVVFTPDLPHVAQACSERFTIGFARLRPWLTPEGVAAVSALLAERRQTRQG